MSKKIAKGLLGVAVLAVAGLAFSGQARAVPVQPWESLTDDSWVYVVGIPELVMHTVNNGDYLVGFDRSKPKGPGGTEQASGMKALRFNYGGQMDGHLAGGLADGFDIYNGGGKNDPILFTDLIFMVAIDAASLPADFALSIGQEGGPADVLEPDDFAFYDPAAAGYTTGRPSGFYSGGDPTGDPGTSPTSEPFTYAFGSGHVALWALSGLSLGYDESIAIDYAFIDLPGQAVFNVYGLKPDAPRIYHTNLAALDANNSAVAVSTFEVNPLAAPAPEPGGLGLLLLAALALRRRS